MSRFFVGLVLWALLLALAACGGDSKVTDPARDAELAEMVDTVASNFDNLPSCTRNHEGVTAYVEDEEKAYVCDGDDWTVDGSLTNAIQSDSEKKSSSSAKAKSSSNEKSDSSSKAKSSSSRDGKSNSSDEEISSSSFDFSAVSLASPCKIEIVDNCEYGTLTDDRDGQTYKAVKIGNWWWMAENLNYETATGSFCYNAEKCENYGRLYTWAAAVGKSEEECGDGKICSLGDGKVRGVCPEGWHLPDTTEWSVLFIAVGGDPDSSDYKWIGHMLKSTEGWNDEYWEGYHLKGNGLDYFGFSALPAGYRYYGGNFGSEGSYAYFWSSTEGNIFNAYDVTLGKDYVDEYLFAQYKGNAISVRCLRDYMSSSSDKNSSSNFVVSTVPVALPCKTKTEDNCEYGTLTDDRDGLTYKTVKIGEQWWMAEDLNYRYIQQTAEEDSSSYCYGNASANCEEYGRLYPWSVAMGICPEGWHLPDTTEWNTLFTAVGGEASAGILLKAKDGWNSSWKNNGYGSDYFGFSALPAGYRTGGGVYYTLENSAGFWSSTEYASNRAYYMYLYYDYDSGKLNDDPKDYAYSVRCLKD